jgi:PAS domain S-box-containing protein
MSTLPNRRILVVDDTPAIHEDFRKILQPDTPQASELDAVSAALFGEEVKAAPSPFELDSAYQGQEARAMVCEALQAGLPYAVAFVDMRMPPGWDGVETIERLWQEDPRLQIVICTAYTEYSWQEMLSRLDVRDRLLILKKPFDGIEICQLASALTAKWQLTQLAASKLAVLEDAVKERTSELRKANEELQADIVERRQAKEQLVETNDMLQAVIDASPVAIVGAAPPGIVLSWNRMAENIFGYSAEEAVGRAVVDLIVPADQRESFNRSLVKIFSGECLRNIIKRRVRKDGSKVDIQLASAPVFAEDGTVRSVVVAMEDITHRKLLEDQLRQSQKMEAIGQLTGGLSHDFNNLLAIIIGNLDLVREELGASPEIAEALDEALNASLRGADLNRRLLAFARRQPLQPRQVDLNELVVGMMKLLSRTLGEHIEITLSTANDLWALNVDPTQLESALTNLAVNARDAMPGGGRLTIGTRKASIDQEYADTHTDVSPGDFVVLEVSDTGTGIPPEVLAHVFEPFFTTKEKEQGTGLGLSMVFGFVKQSGGHIEVYSEVGIGTTLRLYLPRADEAPAEARPTLTAAMPRGHETVLAVEDNEGLRRVLVRQLADLGYRVLEAANAQAAIEILGRDEKIDLLFTDIVLPGGMNGADLARSVVTMRTDMKVLFTSGFPEGAFGPDNALPPGAILLGKPYRKDELARRLRESLAA